MRTRSQKLKSSEKDQESEETSKNEEIPLDLEIEILKRLPGKSLARFLLVSKLWASIIQSRDLIKPRLLVAFVDLDSQTNRQNWNFFSSSSLSSSMSFLSRGACPFLNLAREEYRYQYANGLVCLGYGQEQTICNLTTGKSTTLPKVKTNRKLVKSFFGYDAVNDEYKVLCMTETILNRPEEPSSQHQVFTLGGDKRKSWRMIDCVIPHRPFSNGVCIDGVVYYFAYTGTNMTQPSLMRFDLKSEKLDLFNTFQGFRNGYSLINYKGKVAAVTDTLITSFDVWVMDQDAENRVWWKTSFNLEPWRSLFWPGSLLSIRCGTHTEDFFLVRELSDYSKEFHVFHYNPGKNSFRRIDLEVNGDYEFKHRETKAVVFSDYGESARLL